MKSIPKPWKKMSAKRFDMLVDHFKDLQTFVAECAIAPARAGEIISSIDAVITDVRIAKRS